MKKLQTQICMALFSGLMHGAFASSLDQEHLPTRLVYKVTGSSECYLIGVAHFGYGKPEKSEFLRDEYKKADLIYFESIRGATPLPKDYLGLVKSYSGTVLEFSPSDQDFKTEKKIFSEKKIGSANLLRSVSNLKSIGSAIDYLGYIETTLRAVWANSSGQNDKDFRRGFDHSLAKKAIRDEKIVKALENTDTHQSIILKSIRDKNHLIEIYFSFLQSRDDNYYESEKAMVEFIAKGNDDGVQKIISSWITNSYDSIVFKAIADRNKIWMKSLKQALSREANKTCLIAVGGAHFFGDTGILQLLKYEGYAIEKMRFEK